MTPTHPLTLVPTTPDAAYAAGHQAARAGHDAVTLPDLPDECLEAWLAGWRAAGAGA